MAEEIKQNNIGTDEVTFDDSFDKDEFEVIEPGEYDVVLEKAEKRTSRDGTKTFVNITFRIRSDVEQKFKNRVVWDTLFQDKTNSKWFDLVKLNKIIKTQTNPKKNFANCDECLLHIQGLKMKITIEKEFDTYSNSDRNTVKYLSYKPSSLDIKEETSDLPF